jgi:hypothetical protein
MSFTADYNAATSHARKEAVQNPGGCWQKRPATSLSTLDWKLDHLENPKNMMRMATHFPGESFFEWFRHLAQHKPACRHVCWAGCPCVMPGSTRPAQRCKVVGHHVGASELFNAYGKIIAINNGGG